MKHSFKSSLIKLAVASIGASLGTGVALAQSKAAEPEFTVAFNAGAVTDYRYRGLSQSGRKPALQGGADYSNKNGVYAGAWASTITWIKDSGAGASGPIEVDLYGGYKGELTKDVAFDVGLLQYAYLGNSLDKATTANANTTEIYGALSFGVATAKFSNSLTNLFGSPNSKNSTYLDLSATIDAGGGWSVVPHIGVQKIKNFTKYTDYSVTVNKDVNGLILSAALVGTDKKGFFVLPGSGTKDMGGNGVVFGIKKNF